MTDVQSANTFTQYLPYLGALAALGAGWLCSTEYNFRRARTAAQEELRRINDVQKDSNILEPPALMYLHHRLGDIVGVLPGEDYHDALVGMELILQRLQPLIGDEIRSDLQERKEGKWKPNRLTQTNTVYPDTNAAELSPTLDQLFDAHEGAKTMPLYVRARGTIVDFVSRIHLPRLHSRNDNGSEG